MAKDLVCGMNVDEKTAKYKTTYEGKTYYFCAPGCQKAFEANPQKYLKQQSDLQSFFLEFPPVFERMKKSAGYFGDCITIKRRKGLLELIPA